MKGEEWCHREDSLKYTTYKFFKIIIKKRYLFQVGDSYYGFFPRNAHMKYSSAQVLCFNQERPSHMPVFRTRGEFEAVLEQARESLGETGSDNWWLGITDSEAAGPNHRVRVLSQPMF